MIVKYLNNLSLFNLFQLDALASSLEGSLHGILQYKHVEFESKN